MCMSVCLPMCLYTVCMPGVHKGQKRALDPLKLDLQMTVNFHVGAGN